MSPILLDLQTLSFVLILVTAFLSFVIIFVWRTQKTYDGFGLWVLSNIAVAGGIILLGVDGSWMDLLGTSLTFGAVLIGYEGNRRFLRLKMDLSFSLSVFALQTATLFYFIFFNDNVVLQVSFSSLLVGIVSGICGFIFVKKSSKNPNFSYKFTGISYFIFSLIMICRSIITIYTGDKNNFFKPEGIQPIFFIFYILFEIIWTFNYINLNSSRLYNELKNTQTELEKLATTDYLTGINNKRNFFEISENEIQRAMRFRHALTLIMFDIDHFKKVNDTHGHAAGDEVLIAIADLCKKTLRNIDVFARLGGEEFAILLPHTDLKNAIIVAEHLRSAIEATEVKFLSETIKITVSFGVTEFKGSDTRIKVVLDRADALLYEAKNNGRNQIAADCKSKNYKKLAFA